MRDTKRKNWKDRNESLKLPVLLSLYCKRYAELEAEFSNWNLGFKFSIIILKIADDEDGIE